MPATPAGKKKPDWLKRHPVMAAIALLLVLEALVHMLYFARVIEQRSLAASMAYEVVPLLCVAVAIGLSIRKMF